MFGALALAELAAAFSETGGIYVYLREAYGPLVGFLFGWALLLVIDSGTIATLSLAFATKYLPYFIPLSPVAQKAAAVLFILFLVAINYVGVRQGAFLQNCPDSASSSSPSGDHRRRLPVRPGRLGESRDAPAVRPRR